MLIELFVSRVIYGLFSILQNLTDHAPTMPALDFSPLVGLVMQFDYAIPVSQWLGMMGVYVAVTAALAIFAGARVVKSFFPLWF